MEQPTALETIAELFTASPLTSIAAVLTGLPLAYVALFWNALPYLLLTDVLSRLFW